MRDKARRLRLAVFVRIIFNEIFRIIKDAQVLLTDELRENWGWQFKVNWTKIAVREVKWLRLAMGAEGLGLGLLMM
jgi:hypothetical protein